MDLFLLQLKLLQWMHQVIFWNLLIADSGSITATADSSINTITSTNSKISLDASTVTTLTATGTNPLTSKVTLTDSSYASSVTASSTTVSYTGSTGDSLVVTSCPVTIATSILTNATLTTSTATITTSTISNLVSTGSQTSSSAQSSISNALLNTASTLTYQDTNIAQLQVQQSSIVNSNKGTSTSSIGTLLWIDGTINGNNYITQGVQVVQGNVQIGRILNGAIYLQSGSTGQITSQGLTAAPGSYSSVNCFSSGNLYFSTGSTNALIDANCNNLPTTNINVASDLVLANGLNAQSLVMTTGGSLAFNIAQPVSFQTATITDVKILRPNVTFANGDSYTIMKYTGTVDSSDFSFTLNPSETVLIVTADVGATSITLTVSLAAGVFMPLLFVVVALLV